MVAAIVILDFVYNFNFNFEYTSDFDLKSATANAATRSLFQVLSVYKLLRLDLEATFVLSGRELLLDFVFRFET